jgi:hypothetical protein
MCQAWAATFSCPDAPMKALIKSVSRRVLRTEKSELELIAQALEVISKETSREGLAKALLKAALT